ncbi:hypothetical protein IJ541_03880 [bacterium]|nr:hypothetical protein [bacterium]
MEAKELIRYLKSIGLDVHTSTNARGHQGFYMKKRIDISKNIAQNRIIPTLIHEFSHYVHSLIEPLMERTGGTLEVIFDDNSVEKYEKELILVTNFVDSHSKFEKSEAHKKLIKQKILEQEKIIKNKYPKFLRSKKFKEFDKYIKKSKAKYLLKYDRVKLVSGFIFKKYEILSIDNIEKDFTDMPKEFCAYIRLKSYQKRQSRLSAKINRMKKYYNKPTELFARFVEGLYLDQEEVKNTAPLTYNRFFELLETNYYPYMNELIQMF